MRERMLREISFHASFPSCAMQEGNICSPKIYTSNFSTLSSPTPILSLKRFPILNLDRYAAEEERTGWCWPRNRFLTNTTPSARADVASRLFFKARIHPASAALLSKIRKYVGLDFNLPLLHRAGGAAERSRNAA